MQKQSKFLKYFTVFFLISATIFLVSFSGVLKPAIGFLGQATSPVVSFLDSVFNKMGNFGKSSSNQSQLIQQNEDLKGQLRKLTLENSSLREIAVENESLRKQLGFIESIPHKTISSEVISRSPSSFSKTVMINKGSARGITKGMAVISEGFFVGKILEVTPYTSTVLLITDSNFEVSGFVQQSRALGIIKGQIGSGLAMEMIPQDKEANINDTVITSSLQQEIPEGLVIGKITEIDKEAQGLFQKASIVPFVNLEEIKYVVVVLGGK